MPKPTSVCAAIVNPVNTAHVECFYDRCAPGRSLALLVSDYRVMIAGHVAVAEGDVRLRSDPKSANPVPQKRHVDGFSERWACVLK